MAENQGCFGNPFTEVISALHVKGGKRLLARRAFTWEVPQRALMLGSTQTERLHLELGKASSGLICGVAETKCRLNAGAKDPSGAGLGFEKGVKYIGKIFEVPSTPSPGPLRENEAVSLPCLEDAFLVRWGCHSLT